MGNFATREKIPIHNLLALLVILIWSVCFLVIKASQADAPPLFYAALRAVLGGVPLLAVAAVSGRLFPPRSLWGWIAILGLANTTLGLAGMFIGVRSVGAILPAVLTNSQALIVVPFAALLFRESLTMKRAFGVILGTAGVGLTMAAGGEDFWDTQGAEMGLMAALGLAGGSLVIKHIGLRVDALTATAWQYVMGALPLLGLSLVSESAEAVTWTAKFALGSLFLGLVGSAGASWLWFRLVSTGELIRLNMLTLLTPPLSVALAFALYREPLSDSQVAGIALTLIGVAWAAWPSRLTPSAEEVRLDARDSE